MILFLHIGWRVDSAKILALINACNAKASFLFSSWTPLSLIPRARAPCLNVEPSATTDSNFRPRCVCFLENDSQSKFLAASMDGSSCPFSNTSANVIESPASSNPNGSSKETTLVLPAICVPGCITSVLELLVLRLPALVNLTAKQATVLPVTFLPTASARCNMAAAWTMGLELDDDAWSFQCRHAAGRTPETAYLLHTAEQDYVRTVP